MACFVTWFNRTAPAGSGPLPALAQSFGHPTLIALAGTILSRRKAYYAALEAANKKNEVTAWLSWFAGIVIEAQRPTTTRVEFLIEKTRLLDRLRGELNPRQEKAVLRMLCEGRGGFKGGGETFCTGIAM
jgi:Fic family protein